MVVSPAAWVWMACTQDGCGFQCGLDPVEMEKHTMRRHLRPPTLDERTPIVRSIGAPDALALRREVRHGRVWGLLAGGVGFVRDDAGRWLVAHEGTEPPVPMRAARALDSVMVAALDWWETATASTVVDVDATPATGIARPMTQFLAMAGGL